MKEAELPNLWVNTGMKLRFWYFSCPGLSCLFLLWDLWYFSTVDASDCSGERGEQGALFGNCYGFVCIKVVSPRGSNQEYRQGVLGTLSTHLPRGRASCRHREGHQAGTDQQPKFWPVFWEFSFLAVCYCKEVFGLSHFPDTSHLVRKCSPLKVSMGDKRSCGRNDSQCHSGNYLLILVSAEKVRVELVDLKVCVSSVCVSFPSGGMSVLPRC